MIWSTTGVGALFLLGKDWGILVLAQDMSENKTLAAEAGAVLPKKMSKIILITSWRQIQIPMVALTDNFKMKIALERRHVTTQNTSMILMNFPHVIVVFYPNFEILRKPT